MEFHGEFSMEIQGIPWNSMEVFHTGRRWKNFRKERKGGNDYFNLVFTYVIFNMGDVAISPKYNFEKLLRKLPISDFY